MFYKLTFLVYKITSYKLSNISEALLSDKEILKLHVYAPVFQNHLRVANDNFLTI